jgi:hypothetical protein
MEVGIWTVGSCTGVLRDPDRETEERRLCQQQYGGQRSDTYALGHGLGQVTIWPSVLHATSCTDSSNKTPSRPISNHSSPHLPSLSSPLTGANTIASTSGAARASLRRWIRGDAAPAASSSDRIQGWVPCPTHRAFAPSVPLLPGGGSSWMLERAAPRARRPPLPVGLRAACGGAGIRHELLLARTWRPWY